MARGVNKVTLVGNLGQDPEIRFTQAQKQVATLSIATSEQWNDRQTGEKKEKTEWHRVVIFDKLAEIAGQYLKKGSKVYVEGKLQTRKWQNQQGVDQYTTEVVVNDLVMLDSAPNGQGGQQPRPQQQPVQQGNYAPPQQQQLVMQPQQQQQPVQQQGGYQQHAPQQQAYAEPQQQQPVQQGNYAPPQQQQQQPVQQGNYAPPQQQQQQPVMQPQQQPVQQQAYAEPQQQQPQPWDDDIPFG